MKKFITLLFSILFFTNTFCQTITYPSAAPSFCTGSSILLTANPSVGTFQWDSSYNNVTYTPIVGATGISYNVTVPKFYRVSKTNSPTVTYQFVEVTENPLPTASFTSTPSSQCGTVPVAFTNTSTGASSYVWDFGDIPSGSNNTSTSLNPTHRFVGVPGNATQNIVVKLTATTALGCSKIITNTVTTKQLPDAKLGGQNPSIYNGNNYFKKCTNSVSEVFTFSNTTTTSSTNTNYQIIWGDGTADFNSPTFSGLLTHTYPLGTTTLLFIVSGQNGCIDTTTYNIFLGNNPSVGLGNPGNTAICTSNTLTFPISSTATNTSGTNYVVTFSDGSAPISFTQPAPLTISHTFNSTSCGTNTNPSFPNAFSATILASNPCASSLATVVPIYVSQKPAPAISISPKDTICLSTNVTITNTSGLSSSNDNGTCTPGKQIWSISPATGWTLNSGNFGSNSGSNDPAFWINGTTNLNFTFNTIGTYTIKMIIGNTFCGIDSIIKTICVNPNPIANFDIDNNVGCTPLTVNTTNNSNAPFCGTNKYLWTINYAATLGCTPNTALVSYLNGTNANSKNPQFQFINPGVYTINLRTITPGGICTSAVVSKVVTIKTKPVVSIAALSPICPNQTISPTATSTCYITGTTTYLWSFTGGSPTSANTLSPGIITYTTSGSYTIALDVTNECGTTSASKPLTVNPQPDFTAPPDISFCAGEVSSAYSFTSVPTGATFSWTNSNTTIGLSALGNGNIPSFTTTNNTSVPKTANITVTASNGTCTKIKTFVITINPKPAAPSATSPINYCLNETSVELTATATAGNNLLWYTVVSGGSSSTTAPTPLTATVGPTTYYVSQISTAYNCESVRTPIVVNINPLQTISNLTSTQPTLCGASNGSIKFTVLNAFTQYSVKYLKNSVLVTVNLTSNAAGVITISGLSAGTYSNINASLAGCPSTNLGPVTLSEPDRPATPTVGGNSPICSGNSINLIANSSTVGVAYSWSGVASFASTNQNPTIANATVAMSGNYTVVATLAGCTSDPASVAVTVSQTPVTPLANNNGALCASGTLNLTASTSTVGTITYNWTGVGGFTSTTQNPTIPATTTAMSGVYSVIATNTVGTLSCASSAANTTVVIKPVPQIIDSSAISPATCASATGSIILKGLAINTTFTINYTKNSIPISIPLTSSPTGVITILNLTAGVYANITVTLNSCMSNVVGPFTLTDPTPPGTPVVGSNSPICSGGTINLTATSATSGVTYSWSGPASFASVSQNPSITNTTVSNTGNYFVTATQAGCTSAPANVNVVVNQTPATPTLTSNTTVCTGNTLTLGAGTTTAGAMTFAWTGPNGFTSAAQNPSITNVTQAAAGNYSVIFTSVAGTCPSATGNTTVVINETPVITNGTVTNPTACATANGSITLNGLTANTSYTVNYINNVLAPITVNITTNGTGALVIPNLVTGTYTNFSVKTLPGCTSNILPTFTLTNPTLPVTPVATTNGPLCIGATSQLGATTTSTGTATYSWSGPNGFNSAAQNPSLLNISASNAGVYNVNVTINNCTSAIGSVTLVVNPLAVLPAVITPTSYCVTLPTTALTATPNAGHTLNWYSVPTGGTILPSAPVPLSSTVGSTTYYVSQTTALGCEGARAEIVVKINPDAKAVFNPTPTINCAPFVITTAVVGLQQFAANNSAYQWYANNVLIGTGINFPGYTIANQYDSVTIKLKTISLFGCKADSMEKKFFTYQVPVPTFIQSLIEGCGPLTVSFTNTTTFINLFTYNWDFGNGLTSTLQQPLPVIFATNPTYGDTTYIVKLTVASICNAVTFTKTVRVKSKPRALFTPDRTTGCSPMRVNLVNTSKGLNNNYYWEFDDGSPTFVTTSRNTFQHIFITGVVRNYTIRLIAQNDCGSDTTYSTITTAPNNIQLLYSISGPDRYGCAPHTVAFFNNSNGASSFQWNFGDGNTLATTQNVQTVYHTYLVDGDYTVTLTAANNCTDTSATKQITVYPKPTAAFNTSVSNACIGQVVQMNNTSSSNATSYLWNFGDGTATSNAVSPQHTYTTAGPYTIKLIIYRVNPSGNVCTDTTTRNILIVNTLVGDFNLSATTGTCAPLVVNFNNLTLPSVTTLWDFGDGTIGTGDAVQHTYLSPGLFNVKLTVTVAGGCTYIKTKQINLLGPAGTFTYTGGFKCFGSPVTFAANATNTNTYLWDFGDGTTQTTTTNIVTHNYANPGSYSPSVKLQNTAGCNFPIQGLVPIKVDKITKGFTSTQQYNCGNTVVNFNDTSFAFFGKAQVKWLFGDGGTGMGSNVTHTYNATGSYNIQMIVIGISGCTDTTRKTILVQVNNVPIASIVAATSKCASDSVLFQSNVVPNDPLNPLQWKIMQNGVTATGTNFSYRFGIAGTYTIRLIVGTVNGCFDTAFHTIVINANPVVTSSNNLILCRGNSSQLNTTGAPNYQWTPTNGLSCINCPNPIASPLATTLYVVVGTNSFGCTGSDTVAVKVIQPFDITVTPNVKICIGQSTNLLTVGANNYLWDNGNTLSSTIIANPVATPTITTDYRVIGYDGYNCFADTAFVQVGVGKYPTISLGADVTFATGTLLPLTTTVTNGPIAVWLWKPTSNLSCTICPLPIASIKKDITYIVMATTHFGCSASDTINIKTFCESAQVFIPNAFTPDGDGLNDVLMVRGTGIVSVKYFRIFNRWGEIIFERANFPPNDLRYGWDGKIRGVVGPPDVFVYTAEVLCENGSTFIYKGNTSSIK